VIKADLKIFSKSIENINSTLQRIEELSNTASNQLIDLYEQSKKIHVITQDDIVQLSSIFPAEQILTRENLTPPEPGAVPVHSIPKKTRTRKSNIDLNTEPEEPPATEPEESESIDSGQKDLEPTNQEENEVHRLAAEPD